MTRTAFIAAALTAAAMAAPGYAAPAPTTSLLQNAVVTSDGPALGTPEVTQVRSFFPRNRRAHSPRAARILRGINSNNPHQGAGD